MTRRIVLADDHAVFTQGLKALLSDRPGWEVVDEAADGRQAVAAALAQRPDLVVMDLEMPKMNGMEATRQIGAELPEVKVVCLSMYAHGHFVEAAFEAGAAGYVLKDYAFEYLLQALEAVANGEMFVCPAAAEHLVAVLRGRDWVNKSDSRLLTSREREVLQLVAEGLSSKQIAKQLGIGVKTVGTHRERIVAKTKLHSVAGLTKYALSHGLTDLQTGI